MNDRELLEAAAKAVGTDLRTVAQQALKVLEDLAESAEPDCCDETCCDCKSWRPAWAAIAALKAALEQPVECRWLQDGDQDSGTYMASCGRDRYFQLNDGTPKDNRMTHCCYCSKPLVEVPLASGQS